MTDKKFIFGVVAATIIFLGGGTLLAFKMARPAVQADTQVKAAVSETSFDWGTIKMNGGKVEKNFEIKNTGSQTLKLFGVKTSCMCTSAQLYNSDRTSPEFGMHENSPYIFEIAPQRSANLKVVFDPAYHGPSGLGPITRQVLVETNDPENPKFSFMLTAMVEK